MFHFLQTAGLSELQRETVRHSSVDVIWDSLEKAEFISELGALFDRRNLGFTYVHPVLDVLNWFLGVVHGLPSPEGFIT